MTRRAVRAIGVAILLLATGCATPVVFENPATKERVNCSTDARLAASEPTGLFPNKGIDVPTTQPVPPGTRQADYEQQCAGTLRLQGWICVSGC